MDYSKNQKRLNKTGQSLSIVFVTNNYKPYKGGVVSSIDSCVHELRKVGHKVTIIALDFVGQSLHHIDEPDVVRIPSSIRFLYKNNIMALPWRATYHLFNSIKKIQPNIVHTHHPFLLGQSALIVSKKLSIPIVFTYHTRYEHYLHYLPLPQPITQPLLVRKVQKFCNNVDAIIAPSETLYHDLKKYNITKPSFVVPSGILPIFFSSERKITSGHQFNLLLVSRLVPEKNITFVLDMMKSLPKNFILTIMGYGAAADILQNYAFNTLKLSSESVKFILNPTKELILQHYAQADLFVFSSLSETQGLVLAESMAAGTPIVALYGPGQKDIIQHGKNGFLVHSIQEMADIILHIAHDDNLRTQLQYCAQQTANNYRSEITTQQLLDIYYSIID